MERWVFRDLIKPDPSDPALLPKKRQWECLFCGRRHNRDDDSICIACRKPRRHLRKKGSRGDGSDSDSDEGSVSELAQRSFLYARHLEKISGGPFRRALRVAAPNEKGGLGRVGAATAPLSQQNLSLFQQTLNSAHHGGGVGQAGGDVVRALSPTSTPSLSDPREAHAEEQLRLVLKRFRCGSSRVLEALRRAKAPKALGDTRGSARAAPGAAASSPSPSLAFLASLTAQDIRSLQDLRGVQADLLTNASRAVSAAAKSARLLCVAVLRHLKRRGHAAAAAGTAMGVVENVVKIWSFVSFIPAGDILPGCYV